MRFSSRSIIVRSAVSIAMVAVSNIAATAQSTLRVSLPAEIPATALPAAGSGVAPATSSGETPASSASSTALPVSAGAPIAARGVAKPLPFDPKVDGPVAFAPASSAQIGDPAGSPLSARPELFRRLFVAAPAEDSLNSSRQGFAHSAYGTDGGSIAGAPGTMQAAPPTVMFRKSERTDLFTSAAPLASEAGAFATQDARPLKWGDKLPAAGIASPTSLRPASEPSTDPAQQTSEFRFVAGPNAAFGPLSQNVRSEGPFAGEYSTHFVAAPVETYPIAEQQRSALATSASEPTTEKQDHFQTAASDPAPLTSALTEPHPITDKATFVSPISDPVAGTAIVTTGCPYQPGDSGTATVCGIDCGQCGAPFCASWNNSHQIPWSIFGPGEYVGPIRPQHVSTYYLRVNDLITLTYISSRRKEAERYRIGVGDRLKLEWLQTPTKTDATLDREVLVQPDGSIVLPLIGEINASGKTVQDLRDELIKLYGRYQREPQITVTPLEVNTALQDILNAVTSVSGSNGQTQALRVTPEGTIQAPGLGSVYVQGLTLDEVRNELEARYAAKFGSGLMVSPSLTERATSYVFIGGEVQAPGRYVLEGPTTVMQAITLAGGWNNGGNLRQVVVFRRDENWCLKATKIDVRSPFYGNDPCPTNDVWLRDNDLVIVPKTKILCATDVINLYFTRGVYAAFPISYVYSFSSGSTVTPIMTTTP